MEDNKNSQNKTIIWVLAALLVLLAAYTFYNHSSHVETEENLTSEKTNIQNELNDMIAKYDTAIAENTTMTEELKAEREKIIQLRDSVSNLSNVNRSILARYKGRLTDMEAKNKRLFFLTDSLKGANEFLSLEVKTAQQKIAEQTVINTELEGQNTELTSKINIGSVLIVNEVKATAMKLRSKDKLSETTSFNKTDAFRVSFKIAENRIAAKGNRNVYYVIKDPSGAVVKNAGTITVENSQAVAYTDKTTANYDNKALEVIAVVNVDRTAMVQGTYTIDVYIDTYYVGTTTVDLKNSFLGL
ncbi:MAG: hypothetical protein Q8J84_10125 [Flavobacteriaceae bacterium]|nr:hypothetical protein [Flavobacteriaceae bacterium]